MTNELNDSNGDGGRGNGTYTLTAVACDSSGNCGNLYPTGGVTITVNNAASKLPFGTIDAIKPGTVLSGPAGPANNIGGWAVTPQPNIIPTNGSTMFLVVDGQVQPGNIAYNILRSDIASLFPGLQNSTGAGGGYLLNTTTLWNGTHALSWLVTDSGGNTATLGSMWVGINNPLQLTELEMPLNSGQTPNHITESCNTPNSSSPYLYTNSISATFCGGCESCELTGCGIDFDGAPDGSIGVTVYNSEPFDAGTANAFSVTFQNDDIMIAGPRTAQCTLVSNLFNFTYNATLAVFDPTPQITNVTLSQPLVPGGSAVATISGQYFGIPGTIAVCHTGASPCGASDVTPTVTLWPSSPECTTSCVVTATLTAAPTATGLYDIQLTSGGDAGANGFQANGAQGGSTAQSNGKSVNITPQYNISYAAYIPVDHVSALNTCLYRQYLVPFLYMGDANRGTYRVTESILMQPDVSASTNLFVSTGQTRQYAYGSPANGSALSSLDEDGVANDRYLWNNAQTASTSAMYSRVSYPFASQGQFLAYGSASNPLESDWAAINWNMNTVVNDANPAQPTAYVNFNHTCYPAHIVKVNGQVIYSYTPPSNTPAYIGLCLSGANSHIIGVTTPVVVPNH